MKLIRGLFMLLIGMIGFTAMASTPLTEQKQKIEVVKNCKVLTIGENVQMNFLVLAYAETKYLSSNKAHILRIVTEPNPNLAVITDVGWYISKQPFKKIPYTEKLLENYNLHFKPNLQNLLKQIRTNC